MTIFNNRELDKLFDDITNRFFDSDNISETIKAGCSSGSICYGYTITIGSDGKPVVKETEKCTSIFNGKHDGHKS